MARFLSEAWFALVRATLPDPDGTPDGSPDGTPDGMPRAVTVRHRVTGGPEGDVDYVVRAGSGRYSVEPGADGPVDIEIIEGYDSAAAISQGTVTPAAAFAAGVLRLEGDVALLAARQDDFVALGRLLAPVRAVTTY
jgi:hypothetical protein